MAALAQRFDARQLLAPPHRSLRQRLQQDPAQFAARDLGSTALAVVGLVQQHHAMLVEHL